MGLASWRFPKCSLSEGWRRRCSASTHLKELDMWISGTSALSVVMAATVSMFMALAGSAATAASQATVAENGPGLQGEVWVQPTCPPDRNCTDVVLQAQPLKHHALRFVHSDGQTTGIAHTNANGRYVISLPPGRYNVTVADGTSLACPEVLAFVSGSRFRPTSFVCAMPMD
jgi:hypothetical protein